MHPVRTCYIREYRGAVKAYKNATILYNLTENGISEEHDRSMRPPAGIPRPALSGLLSVDSPVNTTYIDYCMRDDKTVKTSVYAPITNLANTFRSTVLISSS